MKKNPTNEDLIAEVRSYVESLRERDVQEILAEITTTLDDRVKKMHLPEYRTNAEFQNKLLWDICFLRVVRN
jgi:hypothetical protein